MTNPLVAPTQSHLTVATGFPLFEEISSVRESLKTGDWAEGIANTAMFGLDLLGAIADPLKTLIASGVGWVIEHCGPLRHALDILAGAPDTIESYSDTWKKVAEALKRDGEELLDAVRRETAGWHSSAMDAYRVVIHGQIDAMLGISAAAEGISAGVTMAGVVVGTVRSTVRDLVSEAVGALISKALQAATVVLIPKVVPEIIAMVAKWSIRISEWLNKAVRVIRKLVQLCKKLHPLFEKMAKYNEKVEEVIDSRMAKAPGLKSDVLNKRTSTLFNEELHQHKPWTVVTPRVDIFKESILEGSKPIVPDHERPEGDAQGAPGGREQSG